MEQQKQSTLSVAASAVSNALALSGLAQEMDAGFDGGEWSGPAHEEARPSMVASVLKEHGWEPHAFEAEVERRTTAKWAYFSPLTGWAAEACPSGCCPLEWLPHDSIALRECALLADLAASA